MDSGINSEPFIPCFSAAGVDWPVPLTFEAGTGFLSLKLLADPGGELGVTLTNVQASAGNGAVWLKL